MTDHTLTHTFTLTHTCLHYKLMWKPFIGEMGEPVVSKHMHQRKHGCN